MRATLSLRVSRNLSIPVDVLINSRKDTESEIDGIGLRSNFLRLFLFKKFLSEDK